MSQFLIFYYTKEQFLRKKFGSQDFGRAIWITIHSTPSEDSWWAHRERRTSHHMESPSIFSPGSDGPFGALATNSSSKTGHIYHKRPSTKLSIWRGNENMPKNPSQQEDLLPSQPRRSRLKRALQSDVTQTRPESRTQQQQESAGSSQLHLPWKSIGDRRFRCMSPPRFSQKP